MKTVLGLVNFIAAIMSASLNLYFYLTHGDMDKGLIEAIEVTQMMSDYTPLEYALHGLVFVTSLMLQEWVLALVCFPMLAYHCVQYHRKSFKVHCLTREEYRPKQ